MEIGYILFALVIVFLGMVIFTGRKLKEWAVFKESGKVLHLWRKSQSQWFEFGGDKVFYKTNGKKVIFANHCHWVDRFEELAPGEWNEIVKMVEKEKKEEEKKAEILFGGK
jgi:hypothetical protein